MEGLVRQATPPSRTLAVRAVLAAAADAGLKPEDIDGLMVCRSGGASESDLGLNVQRAAMLTNLKLLEVVYAEGASSIAIIQTAAMAVSMGLATTVACVFADAPMTPGVSTSAAFGQRKTVKGVEGLRFAAGLFGGAGIYALAARRYMARYGATSEHLGAVAISARKWAQMNPRAIFQTPLTMEDYLASRWIADPFRLYDCAIPVNGSIAVIVTTVDRARDLARPPVHVLGMGQGHPGALDQHGFERELGGAAALAKQAAFAMADVSVKDIDVCAFYDAFTYSTLATLEDYGFCGRGEAKDFVASGAIAPGGSLPVNTGGGHLSGYYLQGMTPVSEAVLQARGEAGERQCAKHDLVLATNEGGRFDHHACLILSPHARATA
ncbi:MAG: hypothetical protein JWO33_102 [Caulobacteraceae bacterium]|nr:hypothetical protein [Caulobacteraceae bacterium]